VRIRVVAITPKTWEQNNWTMVLPILWYQWVAKSPFGGGSSSTRLGTPRSAVPARENSHFDEHWLQPSRLPECVVYTRAEGDWVDISRAWREIIEFVRWPWSHERVAFRRHQDLVGAMNLNDMSPIFADRQAAESRAQT